MGRCGLLVYWIVGLAPAKLQVAGWSERDWLLQVRGWIWILASFQDARELRERYRGSPGTATPGYLLSTLRVVTVH